MQTYNDAIVEARRKRDIALNLAGVSYRNTIVEILEAYDRDVDEARELLPILEKVIIDAKD